MPGGDGTGSFGQGPRTGRGQGAGNGFTGRGPGGYCLCPQCGAKITHKPGIPCTSVICANCGIKMVRA